MASSKDIYEANVFKANIYAAGIFRGTGAVVVPILGGQWIVGDVFLPRFASSDHYLPEFKSDQVYLPRFSATDSFLPEIKVGEAYIPGFSSGQTDQ